MPRLHSAQERDAVGPATEVDSHARSIAIARQLIQSDPVVAAAIAEYAKLPTRKLHGLLRFGDFSRQRPPEERAKFVLWQAPELTDEEVADIVGIRRETLSAAPGFRAFKNRFLEMERPRVPHKFRGRKRTPLRIYQPDEDE